MSFKPDQQFLEALVDLEDGMYIDISQKGGIKKNLTVRTEKC